MGIQIINGGFLTTIQDMGRYGYQETGMSVSGVMDTRAASLANILVGNDMNEAVIEITMMGPTMKFTEDEIIGFYMFQRVVTKHNYLIKIFPGGLYCIIVYAPFMQK